MALPLVGLTVLTGYLLNKNNDKTAIRDRMQNVSRNDVIKNDKPNGSNIYSSNAANEADYYVFSKSTENYKASQHPEISGILPPLFNASGLGGNTNILTNSEKIGLDSKEKNNLNELNRRINILESKEPPKIDKRPMFNPVYDGITKELGGGSSTLLQSSDFNNVNMSNTANINPLTGLKYETEHKNMVPFFGGVVKQNVEHLTNTSTLDLYTGKMDNFIHKKETTPFYTLMKQDINGSPAITNNIELDRYIPSNYKQNEKISYEERVQAPKAGTIENPIRTFAKSVDELRVVSKPKLTYESRTVSGQYASVRGVTAPMKKNLPDTYYENNPERWFKTTGAIKADASRETFVVKPTSRQDTSESYYGNGYASQYTKNSQRVSTVSASETSPSNITDSLVQDSKRQVFTNDYVRNYNPVKKSDVVDDYGKTTYKLNITQRELNGETNNFNVNINQSKAGTRVYNQDDARATIKETTLKGDNSGHIRTHDKGSMSALESGVQNWEAKATNKQALINNKYIGNMKKDEGMGYNIANYVARTTGKEIITANSEYTGNSSVVTSSQSSRHNFNNAEINDRQEILLNRDRASGPQKFQISSGVDSHGELKYTHKMELKEGSSYRTQQAQLPSMVTQVKSIGLQQNKKQDYSESENKRFQPDMLLSQLKNNPYNINGPSRI